MKNSRLLEVTRVMTEEGVEYGIDVPILYTLYIYTLILNINCIINDKVLAIINDKYNNMIKW